MTLTEEQVADLIAKGAKFGPSVAEGLAKLKPKAAKKPAGKLIGGECRWSDNWIEFDIPLRLEPTSNNGIFKKWLMGQAAKHRREVCHRFAANIQHLLPFVLEAQRGYPIVCTITRIGRGMDDDNIQSCCKQVRDAVALYFGVDDGPIGPIKWKYGQESRMVFGTRIRIELPPPDIRLSSAKVVETDA